MVSSEKFLPNEDLRRTRNLKGWTQTELAERVGTSFEMVSRWERGVTIPSAYFRSVCVPFWTRPLRSSALFALIRKLSLCPPRLSCSLFRPSLIQRKPSSLLSRLLSTNEGSWLGAFVSSAGGETNFLNGLGTTLFVRPRPS